MSINPVGRENYINPPTYNEAIEEDLSQRDPSDWVQIYQDHFRPPEIDSPIEQSLLDYAMRAEAITPGIVRNFHEAVEDQMQRRQASAKEQREKIKEGAKLAGEKESIWGILKTVGECLLSALSVAMGIALIASGNPLLGALLVFVGILEICNVIYTKTGLWDYFAKKLAHDNEEKQKQIRTIVPAVISAVSMIASFGGTFYAMDKFSTEASKSAMLAIGGLASTAQGIASIGGGVCEGRMEWNQTAYDELRNKDTIIKHLQDHFSALLENCFKVSTESSKMTAKCIKQANIMKMRILQRNY